MNKKLIKQKILGFLEKIYWERQKWNGAKGPFDQESIKKRELILEEQVILERILRGLD